MLLNFTKMHGNGNDFVVLDGVRQSIDLTPTRIRALSDRHFGVGADQILLVEPPTVANADFRYRIFNADGSEVEHCGNGARCFVRFVHDNNLSQHNPLRAQIATGILTLHRHDDGQITMEMDSIRFDPAALPFNTDGLARRPYGQDTLYTLPFARRADMPNDHPHTVEVAAVALPNPHVVQWVDNVEQAPVALMGPMIELHPRFPARVNVGFMQFIDRHTIRLRVYERGAGETLSCGTGACAAAIVGIRQGRLATPVRVHTRGGVLTVAWDGETLHLGGLTTSVFTGTVDIDQLVLSIPLHD
jgi:diaminopimelate epimerase